MMDITRTQGNGYGGNLFNTTTTQKTIEELTELFPELNIEQLVKEKDIDLSMLGDDILTTLINGGDLNQTDINQLYTDIQNMACENQSYKHVLQGLKVELDQKRAEIEAKKDSRAPIGWILDAGKGLFGKGSKGELKEIEELEKEYQEVLKNPTQESIEQLYQKINGAEINWGEISAAQETTQNLAEGNFTYPDGTAITQEDIADNLALMVEGLQESFDQTCSQQGVFSKILCLANNNILGLGQTKNMTEAQIEVLKQQVEKLSQTKDPKEFASLYKSITGEELTQESLNGLLQGESKVENTTAAESMMDYEQTQEVAMTTATAIAIGVVTTATGPVGGLLIGASINCGAKAIDAATQMNGKSIGENLITYAREDLVKDALVGSINGFSGVVGNKASVAITSLSKKAGSAIMKAGAKFVSEGTESLAGKAFNLLTTVGNSAVTKVGSRVISEATEGATDGLISNTGEYLTDVAFGDKEFSSEEFFETIKLGVEMGAVMSLGMSEGQQLLGNTFSKLKPKNMPQNSMGIRNIYSPNAQKVLDLNMPPEQSEIIIDLLDEGKLKYIFFLKDYINPKWDLSETQDFARYIKEGIDPSDARIKATRPWDLDSMALYKNKIDTMASKGNQYERELAKFLDIDNMPIKVKTQLLNSNLSVEDAIESIKKLSTSTYRNAMRKPNLYLNNIDPKYTIKQANGHYLKVTDKDLKIQQEAMDEFFKNHIVEMQVALKYTDTDTLNAMMAKRTNHFAQQLDKFNRLGSEDLELISDLIKGKSLDKGLPSLQADEKVATVDLVHKYRISRQDMSGLKDMAESGEISISSAKKALNESVLKKAGLTDVQIANIPENLQFNSDYLYRAYNPIYIKSHGSSVDEVYNTTSLYELIRETSLGNFDNFIFDASNKYGQANLRTKAIFEDFGINYEKWLSPETPSVEINVGGKKLTAQLWDRNPQQDLFLGDMTNCCTQVGNTNGAATPIYLMNTSFNVIKLCDDAGNVVAMSRVYCGDINNSPSLLLDNFEIDKAFVEGLSDLEKDAITDAIFSYGKEFSKEIFGRQNPSAYITYCDLAHRINNKFLDLSNLTENIKCNFIGCLSQNNIYINADHQGWINPLEEFIRNWIKII